MHKPQADVEAYHRAIGHPVGRLSAPGLSRVGLRVELIREESKELRRALRRGDLIGAIDGMCDLIVVTYGTAVEIGIDLEPYWDEVHRTNMAKVGGPIRSDGKALKPEGWEPPNLRAVLERELA